MPSFECKSRAEFDFQRQSMHASTNTVRLFFSLGLDVFLSFKQGEGKLSCDSVRGSPIFSLKTVFLLFFILNVTNSQSPEVTYVTHPESESGLKIVQADSYITNSAICFRLAKKSPYFEGCNEETVYLRLLKQDGSVRNLDFTGLPQESFCRGSPKCKKHKPSDCKYGDPDPKCGKMPNEPGGGGKTPNAPGGGGGTPNAPGGGGGGTPNAPGGGGGTPNAPGGGGGTPNTPGGGGGTPNTPGGGGGTPNTPGGGGGTPNTPGGGGTPNAPGGGGGTPNAPGGGGGTPNAPGGGGGTPNAPGGGGGGTPNAPGGGGGTPNAPGGGGGTPNAPGGGGGGTPNAPGGGDGTSKTPTAPGDGKTPGGGGPGTPVDETDVVSDSIVIYAISGEYILITYSCNGSICGKVVNWEGETTDRIVKSMYDDNDNGGFLYACYKQETETIIWTTYTAPNIENNKVLEKNSGVIRNITKFSSNLTHIFGTEDGGYSIVVGDYNSKLEEAFMPPWTISVYFIPIDSNEHKGPYELYSQTTETVTALEIKRCNIAYQMYGYSCIIHYITPAGRKFLDIDFVSSGAILNTFEFVVEQIPADSEVIDIETLYYGGFCIVATTQDNNIQGFAYSNNGTFGKIWGLPTTNTYSSEFGVKTDNTVWAIADTNQAYEWTCVLSTALQSYTTIEGRNGQGPFGGPGGYGSSTVESTVPEKYAKVSTNLKEVAITYKPTIESSTGTVSFYQTSENGDDPILKQIVQTNDPNYVTINGNEMLVKVANFTFNKGNTSYEIIVDNAAVKASGQNLVGIRQGAWIVTTLSDNVETSEKNLGDKKATVLLTAKGTEKFIKSNKADKEKYVNDMSTEITKVLACDPGRISIPSDRYQYNQTLPDQILLRVDIKESKAPNELIPYSLIKALNDAILLKNISSISREEHTNDLDSLYGAEQTPNLWRNYRWILLGVVLGLLILSIFWIFAMRKYKKGRNFLAIFFFPLVIIDFFLDIIVLAEHGRDRIWFNICCYVFLIIPLLFNSIIALIIISKQLKESSSFTKWWKRYSKSALGFTFLSSIDLEALNFASSKCGGKELLNARFTEPGLKEISKYAMIIVLIEDLPQLIIYSLYQRYTAKPAIIPILALSSACIVLLFKIISSIYLIYIYKPDKPMTSTLEKDDDLGSDTSSLEEGEKGGSRNEAAPITDTTTDRPTGGVTEFDDVGRSVEPQSSEMNIVSSEKEQVTSHIPTNSKNDDIEGVGKMAGIVGVASYHDVDHDHKSQNGDIGDFGKASREQEELKSTAVGGRTEESTATSTVTRIISETGETETKYTFETTEYSTSSVGGFVVHSRSEGVGEPEYFSIGTHTKYFTENGRIKKHTDDGEGDDTYTEYYIENGEINKHTRTEYYYTEDGKIIKRTVKDGDETEHYSIGTHSEYYTKDGKIKNRTDNKDVGEGDDTYTEYYIENGEIKKRALTEYYYTEDDKIAKRVVGKDSVETEYYTIALTDYYTEDGNIKKRTYSTDDGDIYTEYYIEDGEIKKRTLIEYFYTEGDKMKRRTVSDEIYSIGTPNEYYTKDDGTIKECTRTEYYYIEDGKLIKRTIVKDDDEGGSTRAKYYAEDGKIKKRIVGKDDDDNDTSAASSL
ncbi:5526_t:CDS:10, partial [Funneliformis caledonium]